MALIAVFDSGVGGLSVYQNAVSKCSEHDFIFVSDTEAFPYGVKSDEELLSRSKDVVRRLDEHYAPDILIVACNTASTIVLPSLRDEFCFHVIGVVPAIKPAAALSQTGRIAVLATPATVARPYTRELIDTFAKHCDVRLFGSTELVMLAEDKLYGRPLDLDKIATILEPVIIDSDFDVLVLACTHFPLLKDEIKSFFEANGRKITLVDSGEAIANRLRSICDASSLSSSGNVKRVAVTTSAIVEPTFVDQLDQLGFAELEYLCV